MPIDTVAHLKKHLHDEDGQKGICVLIGQRVFTIRVVISSDEGVILSCEPMAEDPPVTNPPPGGRLVA
jgi:hypothetical protein